MDITIVKISTQQKNNKDKIISKNTFLTAIGEMRGGIILQKIKAEIQKS